MLSVLPEPFSFSPAQLTRPHYSSAPAGRGLRDSRRAARAGRGAERARRRGGGAAAAGRLAGPYCGRRAWRSWCRACCSEAAAAAEAAACACEMRPRVARTRAAAPGAAAKASAASLEHGARCMRASARALGSRRPRRLYKHLFRTCSPR